MIVSTLVNGYRFPVKKKKIGTKLYMWLKPNSEFKTEKEDV